MVHLYLSLPSYLILSLFSPLKSLICTICICLLYGVKFGLFILYLKISKEILQKVNFSIFIYIINNALMFMGGKGGVGLGMAIGQGEFENFLFLYIKNSNYHITWMHFGARNERGGVGLELGGLAPSPSSQHLSFNLRLKVLNI